MEAKVRNTGSVAEQQAGGYASCEGLSLKGLKGAPFADCSAA
jgi:hypothetical protein